jgi:hypothetical protein
MKISSPSSGSENKPSGFLLGLHFGMSVGFLRATRLMSQKMKSLKESLHSEWSIIQSAFCEVGTADSSEVKRQERETVGPPASSAEVNNAW